MTAGLSETMMWRNGYEGKHEKDRRVHSWRAPRKGRLRIPDLHRRRHNKAAYMWGILGQYCIVLPEKNAVVTVISLDKTTAVPTKTTTHPPSES